MFSRSSSRPPSRSGSRSGSRPVSRQSSRPSSPVERDKHDTHDEDITIKAPGVLGWFGVKKTIKRRPSEGKLHDDHPVPPQPRSRSPAVASIHSQGSAAQSRENLVPAEYTLLRETPMASSVTLLADSSNRPSSRRPSSRDSDTSHPQSLDSQPIPIKYRRVKTANSSQSSLQLPVVNQSSTYNYFQNDVWTTSPGEGEETLFSADGSGSHWGPGVRPWMDVMGSGQRSSRSSVSSPLHALPELAPMVQVGETHQLSPNPEQQRKQTGRVRSWSDAPRPQQSAHINASHPDLQHVPLSHSVQSLRSASPIPLRPKLSHRPSSGNSAIMDRMRDVFSKTTSRARSKTLSRQASSEVDDFGVYRLDSEPGRDRVRSPSTMSGTSDVASLRAEHPHHALLGLSGVDRHIFGDHTPDRSPRTSIAAASIMSTGSVGGDSTHSVTLLEPAGKRKGRVRASTLSSGPPSSYPTASSSTQSIPIAATPPRRRPSVMQRLSNNVLRSGPGSPMSGPLFPLPAKTSGTLSPGIFAPSSDEPSRPRSSAGSVSGAMGSSALKAIAAIEEGETPVRWLKRVSSQVGRDEIANILAASADEFHTAALRIFMSRFDFTHNALDVALRRLLMHMSLPRETQQIDRVIEAFAVRYEECEPDLFTSKDNTYVLAFSMMMLHTDAFNKNNRSKMTKADYVRNTRMDNLPPLVLEAFYDNITFTPFVFFEDDSDLAMDGEPLSAYTGASVATSAPSTGFSAPHSAKTGKIDVYHMIVRDLLDSLRVHMEKDIPADTPFSCLGTRPFIDTDVLHRAFVEAKDILIAPPRRKSSTGGLLGTTPSKAASASVTDIALKMTKFGTLWRRGKQRSQVLGQRTDYRRRRGQESTQVEVMECHPHRFAVALLKKLDIGREPGRQTAACYEGTGGGQIRSLAS